MILDDLLSMKEDSYGDFQAKLTPTLPREVFLGVRMPKLRAYAKQIQGSPEAVKFLNDLPHKYYDENLLHGCLLCLENDYDVCLKQVDEFLPYVDNWAVCDTMSPKVFAKHHQELIQKIPVWIASDLVYTCRFGMGMLMGHYLDADFDVSYLEQPAAIRSSEYYVNMMVAWLFATALAKQWDATIPFLQQNRLEVWTHNKTIQKAIESYRITQEQKEYLRTLRRKSR